MVGPDAVRISGLRDLFGTLRPLLPVLMSSSFSVLSPVPPRFTKVPVNQIGVSGGVVSFVCQAAGDPKPKVSWNKKGKKVNSQRIEVSHSTPLLLYTQTQNAPKPGRRYSI